MVAKFSLIKTDTIKSKFSDAQIKVVSPFLKHISTDKDYVERTRAGYEGLYPEEIPDLYQVPVGKKRKARVIFYAAKILFYVFFLSILPFPLRKRLAATTKFGVAVLESDIVLSKGGGFLLDRGTTYSVPTHLVTIWISVLLRKPTVVYAQAIGPFDNGIGRAIAQFVLKRVTILLPRDRYSENYAKSVLGISQQRIRLTADSAFELTSAVAHKASVDQIRSKGAAIEKKSMHHFRVATLLWPAESRGRGQVLCSPSKARGSCNQSQLQSSLHSPSRIWSVQ